MSEETQRNNADDFFDIVELMGMAPGGNKDLKLLDWLNLLHRRDVVIKLARDHMVDGGKIVGLGIVECPVTCDVGFVTILAFHAHYFANELITSLLLNLLQTVREVFPRVKSVIFNLDLNGWKEIDGCVAIWEALEELRKSGQLPIAIDEISAYRISTS